MLIRRFFALILLAIIFGGISVQAQETEPAAESHLLQVMLPSSAQRVLPGSVPAEVNQTLEKVIATAGKGKFSQGSTEVYVWAGGGYSKSKASGLISQLTGSIKTAGWQYAVEGADNGVTVFGAVKAGTKQAVVGFYGATDDALIVAVTEIIVNGSTGAEAAAQSLQTTSDEETRPLNTSSLSGSVVGSWSNGAMSMTGYRPQYGGTFTPGRSHLFKYTFNPNGTFEFAGLMHLTTYGCTNAYFQDKRGRYTIDGNQITLTLNKNFWRSTNSCAPSANKEVNHTLTTENYTYRTGRNSSGRPEVCLNSGEGETCYEQRPD